MSYSIPAALASAIAAHQAGDLLCAEKTYRQILDHNPQEPDALHLLGVLHLQRGQAEAAISLIQRAIDRRADVATYHNHLGEALRVAVRLREAIGAFSRAAEIDPDNPAIHNNWGVALKEMGDLESAERHYCLALVLRPDYAEAHNNLGILLGERGQISEAVDAFQKAIAANPFLAAAHRNLGMAYAKKRAYQTGLASLMEACRLDPGNVRTLSDLAGVQVSCGLFDEALANYEKALPNDRLPDRTILFNWALLLFRIESVLKWDGVISAYERNATPDPVCDYEMAVRRGLRAWVVGDEGALASALDRASLHYKRIRAERQNKNVQNMRAYEGYLSRLALERRQLSGEDRPILPVISDSHGLALAGAQASVEGVLYKVRPELIVGAKAWHLAQAENNPYRESLARTLKRVALESSDCLLWFGEIDCRIDEGFLQYHKKHGGDLSELVAQTVRAYVRQTVHAAQGEKLTPVFLNVPAPAVGRLGLSLEAKVFVENTVRMFNEALARETRTLGVRLVDVHATTVGPDGIALADHYLDGHHVRPVALEHLLTL